MADEDDLDLSGWTPYRLSDFTTRQRPTIELLNRFGTAFHGGRIPRRCLRGTGPDYTAEQVILTIFPDDPDFRRAVAEVMPEGSYRIRVLNVHARAP